MVWRRAPSSPISLTFYFHGLGDGAGCTHNVKSLFLKTCSLLGKADSHVSIKRAQTSVFVLIVFWVFLLTRPPCPVAPCQRFGRDFRRCSGTGVCEINVDCKNEVIHQPLFPFTMLKCITRMGECKALRNKRGFSDSHAMKF